MKKIHLTITLAVLFAVNISFAQTGKRISALFLGNSYTSVNNLPLLIQNIAKANGDTLDFDANTPGGQTFKQHSENTTSISKINSKQWDFVILQAQSQEPSFSPQQVENQTTPFAIKLDSMVRANYNCTKTVFYETWGRKNGDPNNCQYYSPLCTYIGMQDRLKSSYKLFADNCQAIVVPAGEAWRNSIANKPNLNLYQTDESHPSIEGSYLTACIFYEALFGKSVINNTYTANIDATTVTHLQNTAHTALIENINYSNIGKYNPCNTSTTSINKNSQIIDLEIYPNPSSGSLIIHFSGKINSKNNIFSINDLAGNCVMNGELNSNLIDVSHLSNGIYVIKLTVNNAVQSLKFMKE